MNIQYSMRSAANTMPCAKHIERSNIGRYAIDLLKILERLSLENKDLKQMHNLLSD